MSAVMLFLVLVSICVPALSAEAPPKVTAYSRAFAANDLLPETRASPNYPQQRPSPRESARPYRGYPESSSTTDNRHSNFQDASSMPAHEHRPFSFNYMSEAEDGMSSHQQVGDTNGKVVGSYMISLADGRKRIVDYIADENGFRANVRTNEQGTSSNESPANVIFHSDASDDFNQNQIGAPLTRNYNQELGVRSNAQSASRQPSSDSWNRPLRFGDEYTPRRNRNDDVSGPQLNDYDSQPRQSRSGARPVEFPLHRRDPISGVVRNMTPSEQTESANDLQGNQTNIGLPSNSTEGFDISRSYYRGRPSQDTPAVTSGQNNESIGGYQGVDRSSTISPVNPEYQGYFRQGRQPTQPQLSSDSRPAPDQQPSYNSNPDFRSDRRYSYSQRQPTFGDRQVIRNAHQPLHRQPSYQPYFPEEQGNNFEAYDETSNVKPRTGADSYDVAADLQRGGLNPQYYNPDLKTQLDNNPRSNTVPRAYDTNTNTSIGDTSNEGYGPRHVRDQNPTAGKPSLTSYFFRTPIRHDPSLATRQDVSQPSYQASDNKMAAQSGPRNAPNDVTPLHMTEPEDKNVADSRSLYGQTQRSNTFQSQSSQYDSNDQNDGRRLQHSGQPLTMTERRPIPSTISENGPYVNGEMPYYHYQNGPDYFFQRS